MIIKKYLHSCLLLEKDGKRLLIDPGSFSFMDGSVTAEKIGPVDAILITHKHQDHFDADVLKQFLSFGPTKICTIPQIADQLDTVGIASDRLNFGDQTTIAGFDVRVADAPHEAVPFPPVDNAGYLIDGLLHPGDSFHPIGIDSCETLALPTSGPWATLVAAIEMADRFKPKTIIPIHDYMIKDFMLERMYKQTLQPMFKERGIDFHPLALDESLG